MPQGQKIKCGKFNRRKFIRGVLAAAAGCGVSGPRSVLAGIPGKNSSGSRIKEHRLLGRTGFRVSDIAFGSAELADVSLLEAVLEAGVNYIDSSEVYSNGGSERIIGRVLKGRERHKVFLTTKIKVRENDTKLSLVNKVEKCLERLQTDYIDCLMYHGPSTVEDLKRAAFHAALDELISRDRVRFRGVSCHGSQWGKVPVTMETILQAAAQDGRFDVMLLVYNFLQHEQGDKILDACRHACGECESAYPKGIPVNTIMRYHHYFKAQGREFTAVSKYADLPEFQQSAACKTCSGKCESSCPYGVPVRRLLVQAHESLKPA